MKIRLFCIFVVLGLVSVSFAQKSPDLGARVMLDSTSITMGQTVHIDLLLANLEARSVTIREVELYCGTSDQGELYEVLSINRMTVDSGETVSVDLDFHPTCAGTWNVQSRLCFSGSGKRDLLTQPVTFTVTE
jgi:hypothetical protein